MAESSLATLTDGFLRCTICFEIYQDPKILSCLHTFCRHCLEKHHEKETTKQNAIHCPLCRQISHLPSEKISDLKGNFYIQNLIEFSESTSAKYRDKKCSFCSLVGNESLATSQCLTCRDFLCDECSKRHNFTRETLRHEVATLEDLQSGRHNEKLRSRQEIPCSEHHGEVLKYFCDTCNLSVCRDCVILRHRQDHVILAPSEAIEKRGGEIGKLLEGLDSILTGLKSKFTAIEEDDNKINAYEKHISRSIQGKVDSMIAKVKAEGKDAQNKLDAIVKEHRSEISKYKQDVENKISLLDSSMGFCRKIISDGKDGEIIFLQEMMKERLVFLQRSIRSEGVPSTQNIPRIKFSKITDKKTPLCLFQFESDTSGNQGRGSIADFSRNNSVGETTTDVTQNEGPGRPDGGDIKSLHCSPREVSDWESGSDSKSLHRAPREVSDWEYASDNKSRHRAPREVSDWESGSDSKSLHRAPREVSDWEYASDNKSRHRAPREVSDWESGSDSKSLHRAPREVSDWETEAFMNKTYDFHRSSYQIEIRHIHTIACREDKDTDLPKLSSVSWLDDNTFVVVDESSEKLKKYHIDGYCLISIPVESILSVTCRDGTIYCGLKFGQIVMINKNNDVEAIVTLPRYCPPVVLNEKVLAVGFKNLYRISCSGKNVTTRNISYVPIVNKNTKCSHVKLMPFFAQHFKNDSIVVSDRNSKTVYLIKESGEVTNEYRRLDRENWVPGGIACDSMGNIYIADFKKRDVTVINADMEYVDTIMLLYIRYPRCLDCSASNKLLVTCDNGVALFDIMYIFNQQQTK